MQKCLMLGAGHTKLQRKFRAPSSASEEETEWVSLDMNREAKPDIVFNLKRIESPIPWWNRIPVKDESFDEVHAYEVMEHFGRQGNYKGFFRGFKELWRILKPYGLLIGTCPAYDAFWAWQDPGHTRIINAGTLGYLNREMYDDLGTAATTDYRRFVHPRWWVTRTAQVRDDTEGFFFAMQKIV